jgi:hypothetical protein
MKKLLAIIVLSFISMSAFSNSAQPGMWNAGGTGTFSFLFPEDSTGFKKVQMAREKVCIQLYRGYAVVKGTYWMYNTSSDTVRIKSGYPINSYYESGNMDVAGVQFDDLYQLKVETNDLKTDVWKDELESTQLSGMNNWYVWNSTFPPNDTTKFEVYFVVNTSYAKVTKGYSKEKINGFIYLLETGANWKQPILEGQILVQLMEGLAPADIRGVIPNNVYDYNSIYQVVKYDFKNLSPTWEDNIVINYKGTLDYNYTDLLKKSEELYVVIDELDNSDLSRGSYAQISFEDPFEVHDASNPITTIFYTMVIILVVLFLGIAFLIYRIVKKKKQRKKNKSNIS